MQYHVINAYPRSGSVFFGTLMGKRYKLIDGMLVSLHIPHIIDNKNLKTVVIIRNPYEAIASHVHMTTSGRNKNITFVDDLLKTYTQDYMLYTENAYENKDSDHLYIMDFNKMKDDPIGQLDLVFDKFKIEDLSDFKKNEHNILDYIKNEFTQGGLTQEHDGHIPREKSSNRLWIEDYVQNSELLVDAYQSYLKISKYFS